MKILQILIASIIAVQSVYSADTCRVSTLPIKYYEVSDAGNPSLIENINASPTLKCKLSQIMNADSSFTYREVTTERAGELATLLGDDINSIDSIAVIGPINDDDISTLWSGTFNGRLKVINIERSDIESGKLPDYAFLHLSEQLDLSGQYVSIYTIRLERIILPEGLSEIGKFAFSYATKLRTINFPSTLRQVGMSAFSDCLKLRVNPMVFPEGFEKIGKQAFVNDSICDIVLPSTLKEIGFGAFYHAFMEDKYKIYCAAETPPVCVQSNADTLTPFGDLDNDLNVQVSHNVNVYVPIGCAETYRSTWGWNYFNNFIETNNFPTDIKETITMPSVLNHSHIFDLSGKRISNPENGQIYIQGGKKYIHQGK